MMPAPLAKGLIIAASVIVAAGIAIYESPEVRRWIEQYRRKLAVALHSLGDEIQPRRSSEAAEDYEVRRRRREELVRQKREELVRRAREEGIAVDLDVLRRIGDEEMKKGHGHAGTRQKSFDDLVGSDGMLKRDFVSTSATGMESSDAGLRRRGMPGFAESSSSAVKNPFGSEAEVLFDHGDDEAPSPKEFQYVESRESSATLNHDVVDSPVSTSEPLIDLSEPSHTYVEEGPQTASIAPSVSDAENETYNDQAASFYSFTSTDNHPLASLHSHHSHEEDIEPENQSTGTLTPRSTHSDHSHFTSASFIGSHASDIGVLSLQNDADHDTRSEVFSEGGFTDAGFSDAGFSEFGEDRRREGVMTPNSWTDVGSDDGS
ncbi:hypothetical protein P154DRAFT_309046 [Amniculicola lignicola CBS 123094]|uniref:Uncharacterized protein n=1 Tax=Amniculicola lignicola CBS 123094 TaxID=1392246 RepID=A0A6A5W915_9PLEO|nr:hypothetical protein P154DRAFT_309046 [Amniculicola lignicola CBS 123094]